MSTRLSSSRLKPNAHDANFNRHTHKHVFRSQLDCIRLHPKNGSTLAPPWKIPSRCCGRRNLSNSPKQPVSLVQRSSYSPSEGVQSVETNEWQTCFPQTDLSFPYLSTTHALDRVVQDSTGRCNSIFYVFQPEFEDTYLFIRVGEYKAIHPDTIGNGGEYLQT